MAEKKEKAVAKKPAAKAPAKKAAPKASASEKESKLAPAKKSGGKTLRVTQTASPIGRQGYQRSTLIGLGLNKIGRTRELQDTPAVRGMINSIGHLVRIEEAA